MTMKTISAQEAVRLMAQGARLVDVREPDEHARERIEGAKNAPLSRLEQANLDLDGVVLFHCKSGMRTRNAASQLAQKAGACDAYIVDGGLEALRKAGAPVRRDASQPLELQRQVQIAAGSLGLGGTILGLTVSPWFFGVPAFVGAGLIFAGVTGFCGMARLLVRAPWNARADDGARSGASA